MTNTAPAQRSPTWAIARHLGFVLLLALLAWLASPLIMGAALLAGCLSLVKTISPRVRRAFAGPGQRTRPTKPAPRRHSHGLA